MTKRILVVDDSATIRQQLRVFLESNGFEVGEAENGQAALEAVRVESFNLLIVDVNMPGITGLELVERVRKLPAYAKIPVFVLTTESTQAIIAKGKEVGATAWIVKPFKPDILLKGIKKVLV